MKTISVYGTKRRNNKAKAEKKVGIAIDKLIDIVDLDLNCRVSEMAGRLLDRLRELESEIRS